MRERLTEGGVCAIEVMNKDATLTQLPSSGVRELDFGMVAAQYDFDTRTSQLTITRDVLRGEVPDLEYDGRVEYKVRQYSPPELERVCYDAGFDKVVLFGGCNGTVPSLDNGKLIVLAR